MSAQDQSGQSGQIAVKVYLFGHYSAVMQGDTMHLTLPENSLVKDAVYLLEESDLRLKGLGRYCRFAVNEEYVAQDVVLVEGDTLAALPPMSGG